MVILDDTSWQLYDLFDSFTLQPLEELNLLTCP